MSPAEENTGTPPAATYERLEQWREIAAAVKTALDIGGEAGMDLLIGRMSEWSEAVDEWSSSLHVCWDMASQGKRDEARQWHADGFFAVGVQLLEPFKREGWADWQAALEEREVPVPHVDQNLGDIAKENSSQREFELQDNFSRPLQERLAALRRNVIGRGDLGERLTLLTSIRSLDAGSQIWKDMIAPIRRQRAGQIEAEIETALQEQNFNRLARLIEEVQTVDWEGQVSGRLASLAKAVPSLLKCREGIHSLEEAATLLGTRCRDLQGNQGINLPSFSVMLKAALQARKTYLATRQGFVQSLQHANSTPETASVVAQLKLLEQAQAVESGAKKTIAWLAQQEQFEEVRAEFCRKEDDIQKLIKMAPSSEAGWDEFKQKAVRWLQLEGDLRISTNRLCERCPGFVPPSTSSLLAELAACRTAVKADRDRVAGKEKVVIAIVVGVLLLVVSLVVIVFISAVRRSGS